MISFEAEIVNQQIEDNAASFCTADGEPGCECRKCETAERESMTDALRSYVPQKDAQQVSDCCGAYDRDTGNCDSSYGDFGICPECKDHCEYVDEEED